MTRVSPCRRIFLYASLSALKRLRALCDGVGGVPAALQVDGVKQGGDGRAEAFGNVLFVGRL